jgi:hypothetical protein
MEMLPLRETLTCEPGLGRNLVPIVDICFTGTWFTCGLSFFSKVPGKVLEQLLLKSA